MLNAPGRVQAAEADLTVLETRVTVGKGHALAARLTQAGVLVKPGDTLPEAVRRIMPGLGVSQSTARRYLKRIALGMTKDPARRLAVAAFQYSAPK